MRQTSVSILYFMLCQFPKLFEGASTIPMTTQRECYAYNNEQELLGTIPDNRYQDLSNSVHLVTNISSLYGNNSEHLPIVIEQKTASVYRPWDDCKQHSCLNETFLRWSDQEECGNNLRCFCDNLCLLYDDCCHDAPPLLWSPSLQQSFFRLKSFLSCFLNSTQIIASCPTDFQELDSINRCEYPNPKVLLETTPVFHDIIQIPFRNVHCALCHEFKIDSNHWTFLLNTNESGAKDTIQRELKANIKFVLYSSAIQPGSPNYKPAIRQCQFDMISTCNISGYWSIYDEEIENNCTLFSDPVLTKFARIPVTFRNSFCAQCNGYRDWSIQQRTCSKLQEKRVFLEDDFAALDTVFFPKEKKAITDIYSGNMTNSNLTSFNETSEFSNPKAVLSLVCCVLSIIALTISLVTFVLFKRLQTVPGYIKFYLCLFLLLALIMFTFGQADDPAWCVFLSASKHYLWLSTFLWMAVCAFDTFMVFHDLLRSSNFAKKGKRRLLSIYFAIASGIPLVFVSVCIAVDRTLLTNDVNSIFGYDSCWFSSYIGLLVSLIIPLILILIFNITFFALSVYHIRRNLRASRQMQSNRHHKESRNDMMIFIRMSTLMGFAWIIGFVATWTESEFLKYVFIITAGLQGVFICFSFTLKKSVFLQYKALYETRMESSSQATRSTSLTNKSSELSPLN